MQPWRCLTPGRPCPYKDLYEWMESPNRKKRGGKQQVIDVQEFSEKLSQIPNFDPCQFPSEHNFSVFCWAVNLGAWGCAEFLLRREGQIWGEVSGVKSTPLVDLLKIYIDREIEKEIKCPSLPPTPKPSCRRILNLLVEKCPASVNMTSRSNFPQTPMVHWLRIVNAFYGPCCDLIPRPRLSAKIWHEIVNVTALLLEKGAKIWPVPIHLEQSPERKWMCEMKSLVTEILDTLSLLPLSVAQMVVEFAENPLVQLFGQVLPPSPLAELKCSAGKKKWKLKEEKFAVEVLEAALTAIHGNCLELPLITLSPCGKERGRRRKTMEKKEASKPSLKSNGYSESS